ncbi:MAG: hypothetical protein EHM61_27990 [Acidobacteria bacterium]|nr:MAG: hypothetical protein EHM61_27990 [Acidobacteriota bacterium]
MMKRLVNCAIWACLLAASKVGAASDWPEGRIAVAIKYLAQDAVYLEGGKNLGLTPKMKLQVYHREPGETNRAVTIADLEIVSVASTSSVCRVLSSLKEISQGDTAVLSARDQEQIELKRSSRDALKYPQVVSFTEGDPIEEELREYVPRPRLPETNRVKGRLGFEYGGLSHSGSSGLSYQTGLVLRADMTRIAGTFWGFTGYYRGRLNSRRRGDETLTDLVNRTYKLGFTYNNPQSGWLLGFGRLQVPWATSLSTIDGAFMGRRAGHGLTMGLFGGSAPDPTSWRYAPDRQLAGAFVNLEAGSLESLHYNGTAGFAFNRLNWQPDRQFTFFENGLFYKRILSVYQNLEVDRLADPGETKRQMTPSRSFTTVRVQPATFVSFDVSHNYFREIPTFDPRLVGTGLVDRLLFEGLSAGIRLELPYRVAPYVSLGRSTRSGDQSPSYNKMLGIYLGRIWKTGIRADARYSKFDSSLGAGSYSSLSLTREFNEKLRIELLAGQQVFSSQLSPANEANWLGLNADWLLGHYFLGAGINIYRGNAQDYDQWFTHFGYRF